MSDPKYPEYSGVLRFDDDNIVEVGLEPDTENITVKLNGTDVSGGGGSGLPEVTEADNGDVLTVVEGAWAAAAPAAGGSNVMVITITVDETTDPWTVSFDKTAAQVKEHLAANDNNIIKFKYMSDPYTFIYYEVGDGYTDDGTLYVNLYSIQAIGTTAITVYGGMVNIGSDSITWDDTLGGATTGFYPGTGGDILYESDN